MFFLANTKLHLSKTDISLKLNNDIRILNRKTMFLIVKHTYSSADRIIQIHLCVFMEHKLIYDP